MDRKQIYGAFVKAQQAFAPALKQKENAHFKNRYVDLAGCVEAVIDALNSNGIGLVQRTYEDMTGVTVETVLIHESGEHMECGKLHVPASKQDPQGYGSAITYARRYSLMAACGIAPEDDDGNAASARPAAPKAAAKPKDAPSLPPVTPEMIATHISAMEATKSLPALKEAFAAAWRITQGASAVKNSYEKFKTILEAAQ